MDLRRVAFRVTEIFDYRTFVVAGGFVTLVIAGFLVVSSAQTAHDALSAQQQSRQAAVRRIDLLTAEGEKRDAEINRLSQTVGRQQAGMSALAEQVRQQGGRPVYIAPTERTEPRAVSPAPRSQLAPTRSASPKPSSRPSPSPSPSPTCRRLPIIGCPGAGR